MDKKDIFKTLEKSTLGITSDTLEQIASQYALHQIKDIKEPEKAAKQFKELVKRFIDSYK